MAIPKMIRRLIRSFGYDLMPVDRADELYFSGRIPYMTEQQEKVIETCRPFTQTSRERMFALVQAVEYVIQNGIHGTMVECGVWRGGSVMAMVMTLDRLGETRDLFLFDTFAGMPSGSSLDVDLDGNNEDWYRKYSKEHMDHGQGDNWNAASLSEVKKNFCIIEPTNQKFHYVEGKVEETIPGSAPESIALLHLDTDFYSSTKHELMHLFPRLSKGGVLIIDDYGHFLGARQAVDEYFVQYNIKMFMHRVDYTGVIGIKL